jgi:hypothetical protein
MEKIVKEEPSAKSSFEYFSDEPALPVSSPLDPFDPRNNNNTNTKPSSSSNLPKTKSKQKSKTQEKIEQAARGSKSRSSFFTPKKK